VIGTKLILANAPFTIVGVMPKGFMGVDPTERPEIYAPLWAEPILDAPYDNIAGGYHSWWLRVIARRKPGVSFDQANAAVETASNPIVDEANDPEWAKMPVLITFALALRWDREVIPISQIFFGNHYWQYFLSAA
jgi:hypothetical protein